MLTSYKTRVLLLISCAMLTACASPGTHVVMMSPKDIETFQVDCDHKEQQLKFLRDNLPSAKSVGASRAILHNSIFNTVSHLNGSYDSHAHLANGWSEALIRRHINYLQTWCP